MKMYVQADHRTVNSKLSLCASGSAKAFKIHSKWCTVMCDILRINILVVSQRGINVHTCIYTPHPFWSNLVG